MRALWQGTFVLISSFSSAIPCQENKRDKASAAYSTPAVPAMPVPLLTAGGAELFVAKRAAPLPQLLPLPPPMQLPSS